MAPSQPEHAATRASKIETPERTVRLFHYFLTVSQRILGTIANNSTAQIKLSVDPASHVGIFENKLDLDYSPVTIVVTKLGVSVATSVVVDRKTFARPESSTQWEAKVIGLPHMHDTNFMRSRDTGR